MLSCSSHSIFTALKSRQNMHTCLFTGRTFRSVKWLVGAQAVSSLSSIQLCEAAKKRHTCVRSGVKMDSGQEEQADNENATRSCCIVMNLWGRLLCLPVSNTVKLNRKLTLKGTQNAMDCDKDCKDYNIFGFPKNAKVEKNSHTQLLDRCVIKKWGAGL